MKLLAAAVLLTALPVARAQDGILQSEARPKSYIAYAPETHTITAGKNAIIEVRFKVQDGFHVNSHTPRSEFLIPTMLKLEPAAGVKVGPIGYPAGTAYSFSFEPNEKLDVYSGSFAVRLPVVAAAGEHQLSGELHYQACDQAACYPPKTLPVEVSVTAR